MRVGLDVVSVQVELDVANNRQRTVKWSGDLFKRPSCGALGTTLSKTRNSSSALGVHRRYPFPKSVPLVRVVSPSTSAIMAHQTVDFGLPVRTREVVDSIRKKEVLVFCACTCIIAVIQSANIPQLQLVGEVHTRRTRNTSSPFALARCRHLGRLRGGIGFYRRFYDAILACFGKGWSGGRRTHKLFCKDTQVLFTASTCTSA